MARTKQYKEEEVVERAMGVFWRQGYGATSVRTLEREMGINQFSIYASFKNKRGVLLASLRCYMERMKPLVDKLQASAGGVEDLKKYFHDFLDFAVSHGQQNGCLLHNTLGELSGDEDAGVRTEILPFVERLTSVIRAKLATDAQKDAATLDRQVNYLLVSLQGLTAGSKVYSRQQLNDYIEVTFDRL